MYIVLEMQTNGSVTSVVNPVVVKNTLPEALQAFHMACSYAAVSDLESHTVMLIRHDGTIVENREFKHGECCSNSPLVEIIE